ncbi:MAG: type II toxin-antitoxin system RelE/ParE family toxin [Planctomycetes bacterium]|nr:type II toxin-antitoxin system RelE/ParE family toxin [Planctomycetota bacterium]
MSRAVEISVIAGLDLRDIHEYISARNPAAADRILERIRDALETLAILPGSGQVHPKFSGLRRFPAGKFVIFYRLRGNVVWIQRILHSSRDSDRLL